MSNLEAIKQLDKAFSLNKAYKKKWTDYIEMSIMEILEANNIPVSAENKLKIAQEAGTRIIRLFDPVWWDMQEEGAKNV